MWSNSHGRNITTYSGQIHIITITNHIRLVTHVLKNTFIWHYFHTIKTIRPSIKPTHGTPRLNRNKVLFRKVNEILIQSPSFWSLQTSQGFKRTHSMMLNYWTKDIRTSILGFRWNSLEKQRTEQSLKHSEINFHRSQEKQTQPRRFNRFHTETNLMSANKWTNLHNSLRFQFVWFLES
jgi:hypothetical protein